MNFDRFQEPEECKPRYVQDSADSFIAPNCMECDCNDCEHWEQWNEQIDETPDTDMYCDTYASLARHGDYLSA